MGERGIANSSGRTQTVSSEVDLHATGGRRQFGRRLRHGHSSPRTTMRRVMAFIWVRAADTRTHARSGRMAGTDSWAVAEEEVRSSDEKDQTEQARVRSHLAVAAGTSSCGTLAEHDLSATCRWELPRAGIAGCTGRWLDRVGGRRVDPPANRGEPGRIRADKTVNCRMRWLTVSSPREWAATARAGHVACSTDRAAPRLLLETPGAGRLASCPNATCALAMRSSLFDRSSALAVTACPCVRNKLIARLVTDLMFHRAPARAELR